MSGRACSAYIDAPVQYLKGIGPSKAEAIVAYREANGAFDHVDELVNVKGIGVRTIDQNRGMILLQDAQEPAKD
jgi:competence protein ComEA